MRTVLKALTGLVMLGVVLGIGTGPVVARPSNTLTYQFTNCTGPAGTPSSFDAVKQPGGAAALRLVGSNRVFVAMEAVVVASGEVLFTTRGIQKSAVNLTTCLLVHPVTHDLQRVKGLLTPPA